MAVANPTWVNHPGFYIKEEMEARGWNQRDLAFILGCPEQSLNTIMTGKRGISPDMAQALGETFDVPAKFFANLQQAYELARANRPDPGVKIRARLAQYPVREMIKRQWIENSDATMLESQLVRFLEVKDSEHIPYMAHAAKKSKYEDRNISPPQIAWLFRVRQIAKSISVPRYSDDRLREALVDLEDLLNAPEEARHVPRIMHECGVRYVIVERLPNSKIDGVCFWFGKSPVIGMSLIRDKIDNFWFVLRHEIEHVLRGHGREAEMIDEGIEDAKNDDLPEEERIANEAAAQFCVPQAKLESFLRRKHPLYYEKDVLALSRVLNRHSGLIVGQMQRRLDDYAYLTRHLAKIRRFVLPGAIADGWGQVVPVSL